MTEVTLFYTRRELLSPWREGEAVTRSNTSRSLLLPTVATPGNSSSSQATPVPSLDVLTMDMQGSVTRTSTSSPLFPPTPGSLQLLLLPVPAPLFLITVRIKILEFWPCI